MLKTALVCLCICFCVVVCKKACYWSDSCPYQLFSSLTPYDTIRGDVRDHNTTNCEAVSLWHLQRHGNKNPEDWTLADMKYVYSLRDEIVRSFNEGRSQLCAQDIEDLKKFVWNSTLETTSNFLSEHGYKEIYKIASRIRQRYPELMMGGEEDYYFRYAGNQRTSTSGLAYIQGISEGTNLTGLKLNPMSENQDIIRPYDLCTRHRNDIPPGIKRELEAYDSSPPYLAIRDKLQQRLGITTILKPKDVFSFYENCRFFRSWSDTLRSPWCAVFTDEDLEVLEYRDDVRHYWKNGYGSWTNPMLGSPLLKDLYEKFKNVVEGDSRKLTAYFSHKTMIEMVYCALGLYKDPSPVRGAMRNVDRKWRTSLFSPYSNNLLAVLNKCTDSPSSPPQYKVQLLLNEKEMDMCRPPGCSWGEFEAIFQKYKHSNFDFCKV